MLIVYGLVLARNCKLVIVTTGSYEIPIHKGTFWNVTQNVVKTPLLLLYSQYALYYILGKNKNDN